MFGNIPNNNSNNPNVNSKAITFFGDISCMTIGWWDDKFSIKINPLLNISEDGKKNYDTEKRINTALIQEKAAALASLISVNIFPTICDSLDNNKKLEARKSVMLPVSQAAAIGIELRPSEKSNLDTFLVLYKNIKPDNTCDEKYEYKFNQTHVVLDYDPEKGDGKEIKYEAEFLTFKKLLESAILTIAPVAHASKYSSAVSSKYKQNNNGYNNQQNGYNNQQQSAPVSNIGDESDDLPF